VKASNVDTSASHGTDVITLGETMALMAAATPGPLAHVDSLKLGIGGAESNVAIGLRRLGHSVAWIGRVGADSLGDLVQRELTAEGIHLICHRDTASPTGLMIKERRTSSGVKVWYYRAGSAGSNLAPTDIPAEAITHARLLHLTGITPALSSNAANAAKYALDCAIDAGTTISFDFNYRSSLWSREEAARVFRHYAARVDIVFAGEDEAEILVGESPSPLEAARRISHLGPSQVIIKRGAAGCLALIDGIAYEQPAVPVKVEDTVGAGDAFVAGYLSEMLRGSEARERLQTAVQTGAFVCQVPGDWEGLPTRSDLILLEKSDPVSR
jgi:2-dehydro-3-deoxygluconokinase